MSPITVDLVLTDEDIERIAVAVAAKLKLDTKTSKTTKVADKGTETKSEDKGNDASGDTPPPSDEEVLNALRELKSSKGEAKLGEVLHKYAPSWKQVKKPDQLAALLADVKAAIAAPAVDDDI